MMGSRTVRCDEQGCMMGVLYMRIPYDSNGTKRVGLMMDGLTALHGGREQIDV